ncbi:MAG TPA: DNA-binding protein WhiA [Lachnospiraceae bacterium]|nr:DNA-binding protein WhiA [Lachnospiraceae bacterium]
MSFSGNVKEELGRHTSASRHCQIAELAAIYSFCKVETGNTKKDEILQFETENEITARKCFTLLKKTFNIYTNMCLNEQSLQKKGSTFQISIDQAEAADRIIQAVNNPVVTQKACCRRAYIRGAFLSAGSVSNPEKSYHFEIVCQNREQAILLQGLFHTFEIEAKMIVRKKYFVVYIKEGSQIVEALNVMEAPVALMEFENLRILKEMRNSVNRRVNCETANIGKTVLAAVKQRSDIEAIIGTREYKELPDSVKAIAELRIRYPNASLKELGELSDPPIGKSGVNHRLRKLSELAEKKQQSHN